MKAERVNISEFVSTAHQEGFCVTVPAVSAACGASSLEAQTMQSLTSFDSVELYRICLDI